MKYIILLLLFFYIPTIGCGYHVSNTGLISTSKIKNIRIYNNAIVDSNSFMRCLRNEFRINNINIVNYKNNAFPLLQIDNLLETKKTTAIFQDGKTAEYQMILIVYAHIIIPGKNQYSLNINIHRYFFDNSSIVVAKDTENNLLQEEMLQQAAQQLIQKILLIPLNNKNNITHHASY